MYKILEFVENNWDAFVELCGDEEQAEEYLQELKGIVGVE